MKKKSSIYLLVAVIFFGCGEGNVEQKSTSYRLSGCDDVLIVVIDSCEYLRFSCGNATWGSHKGNCRFCAERRKNNCP
jgi:hypothetical protein